MARLERVPDRKRERERPMLGFVARATAVLGTVGLALRLGAAEPRRRGVTQAVVAEDPSGRGAPGTPASGRARRSGHETEDMSGGLMVKLGFMLGGVACAVVFGMIGVRTWVTRVHVADQPALTALQVAPFKAPAPGLQANAVEEWQQVRGRAEELLDNYAWVDPEHKRARIPIERAIALTAGQGLEPPP